LAYEFFSPACTDFRTKRTNAKGKNPGHQQFEKLTASDLKHRQGVLNCDFL